MPTAYSIAAAQYEVPRCEQPDQRSGLRYSIHANAILRFFARHRTALASQVRRFLPHLLSSDRDARRHLRTMFVAGELDILTYNDPRRPNVYVLTERGLDHARDLTTEAIPAGRDVSTGDHLLHEILTTEVAVARHQFLSSRHDFESLWEMRFGFRDISGFEDLVPDYAQLYRSVHGQLVDFIEVYSGERSLTRIIRKLEKYAEWSESAAAVDFLTTMYEYFGAKNPRVFFRLLLVVHNRNLIRSDHSWERQILGATCCVPQSLQRRIWTATNDALHGAMSIDDPIWHCGADLVRHRERLLSVPRRKRTALLSAIVRAMPRRELFTFENLTA